MYETKIQLQSKSLWDLVKFHCLYYYSGFIQRPAVENHSQNNPCPSQNPRENKESIWLTKKNYTRPCCIMCGKMCAWFKFGYGLKNLLLTVYQYFILLAFFRFPQFIGEYGGKTPDFWHADKALRGYKIIWSHYWEIQRSSTSLGSRGYTNTATKKHFYRCSWTKRGRSTDYNVLENTCKISVFLSLPLIFSWILEEKTRLMK